MIVKAKDGGFVRMEDIATVELAAQSTDASVAFNGEHAIFIGVQATPQGNPLTLVKGVRALFPELERNLPPSMKMKVAYDSTKFIQSSIDEVEKTLGEAVLIVVVVIFLFLASFRSVIIPVVTIPLSLIGVCTLMLVAGIQLQPADAAGDGAGDRARGRRRHRGGGEHPSPSGGGQDAGAGLAAGRARNRRPRHLDDDHAGRGVCADRLPRRPDRLAVPRIRFHARGLGDRVRRDRADAVADDVLGVSQERGRGAVRQARQPGVRRDDALVRPQARSLARLPADHRPVRADHPRPRRLPLYAHLEGAGAGGRSGHRVRGDQGAEIRQYRLPRFLRRKARQGVREFPGDRPSLRAERHQRPAERHRRHAAEAVG